MEDLIILIVIGVLFGLGRIVKFVIDAMAGGGGQKMERIPMPRQGQPDGVNKGKGEALRDFLKRLEREVKGEPPPPKRQHMPQQQRRQPQPRRRQVDRQPKPVLQKPAESPPSVTRKTIDKVHAPMQVMRRSSRRRRRPVAGGGTTVSRSRKRGKGSMGALPPFVLQTGNVKQGVVWAEVLGRPRCLKPWTTNREVG